MLLELVLPCVARTAAFAPVENEIFELLQGEGARHMVELLQNLQHVLAGHEVMGQGFAASVAETRCGRRCRFCGWRAALRRSGLRIRGFSLRHRRGRHGLGASLLRAVVDRQQQTLDSGALAIQTQQADPLEGGADAPQILCAPERQQLHQVGLAHVQPRQALLCRGRLVLVQGAYLLQHNGLLQPDGTGKFGGKLQLRLGDEGATGHCHGAQKDGPASIPSFAH